MNASLDEAENLSVCLVHDWLVDMRGGEKVFEAIAELFPKAPVFTLFYKKRNLPPTLRDREIHSSLLQWIPGIFDVYRWLLPFFPLAVRSLNVKKYDVVISSSHCVAKAIRVKKNAIHICYCHTPMRYLWGFKDEYLGRFPTVIRWLIELYFKQLRKWDVETSRGVTVFIANSKNTATKILQLYGKEATVIHPPVQSSPDAQEFSEQKGDGFFLVVSALVPYKRVDLAIEAFNQLGLPLRIVGHGPLRKHLEGLVRSSKIVFQGQVDDRTLYRHYANCKAVIFPGEEDFGIVPVEAQMFGKPVIAYGRGGVTESVLPHNMPHGLRPVNESTGLFFYEPSVGALMEQIRAFENLRFNPAFIRAHAQQFNATRFHREVSTFMEHLDLTVPIQTKALPV